MQTSESFRLSAILSFSGGFQDAYTYCMRDHVFANAQTGNVVLMSQNFMQGNAVMGFHYYGIIIIFAIGGVLSNIWGIKTILFSTILLASVIVMMIKEYR